MHHHLLVGGESDMVNRDILYRPVAKDSIVDEDVYCCNPHTSYGEGRPAVHRYLQRSTEVPHALFEASRL